MRKILILFIILTAVAIPLQAQTVLEKESSILFGEKSANVTLVVVNDGKAFDGKIELEFIDTNDTVRGRTELQVTFEPGRTSHLIAVNFGELSEEERDNLAWFRIRYQAGRTSGIVSVSEIAKDLFELNVIGSDIAVSGMFYRARVRAVDSFTKRPVRGVEVSASLALDLRNDDDSDANPAELKLNKRGETDADGIVIMDFPIPADQTYGGDGTLVVTGRKHGIVREAIADVDLPTFDYQFLTLLDKPIYQPGQTLNVRGILLKGALRQTIAPEIEVVFSVTDESDTVVHRRTARTSAFGVAAIDWKIPEDAKPGDYSVLVRVTTQDAASFAGSEGFKIQRYELPNFVVNARALKSFYLPTERTAEVEVSADYLFGKPVSSGKVRIVRETGRTWNWKEKKFDVEEGESHEGATDKNGIFRAAFDLGDDHDELKDRSSRFEDLRFTAYLTDLTTNRTEERRFDVRISREPIHVYYIGSRWDLNPNIRVPAYVSTFYADGTPAVCDVEFNGREAYGDDKTYRPIGKLKTNKFGVGKIVYRRPNFKDSDENLEVQLIAKDRTGLRGTNVLDDDEEEVYFEDQDDPGIGITLNKTIFKPGEAVEVEIESTIDSGAVFIDVTSGQAVVDSRLVNLSGHRARVRIPFRQEFRGVLGITAFTEHEDEFIRASRGVIFPHKNGLNVDAKFDREIYKPGSEASLGIGVVDENNAAVEAALGLAVVDKSVEERARTDFRFSGFLRGYRELTGFGPEFGGVNLKEINALDLTKSVGDDLQLVAEILVNDQDFRPNLVRSRGYLSDVSSVFAVSSRRQFEPLEKMLKRHFETKDADHPTDQESFERILRENGVDPDSIRDPWNQNYRVEYAIERELDVVRIKTSGPDKKAGTPDDFVVSVSFFEYFKNTAKLVDRALKEYRNRTGKFIRDEKTMLAELGVDKLIDRFGRPYQFKFGVAGRNVTTFVRSVGPDGVDCGCSSKDDFVVWSDYTNYFAATELRINWILRGLRSFPKDDEEFRAVLKSGGLDFSALRDFYDEPVYLTKSRSAMYEDRVTVEKYRKDGETVDSERRVITPVVREFVTFSIRSKGEDRLEKTKDDATLAEFSGAVSERTKDDAAPKPVLYQPIDYRTANGSIAGSVTDANGAAVPGATVTVTNEETDAKKEVTTSDSGRYAVTGLTAGNYTVTVNSSNFQRQKRTSIAVSGAMIILDFVLEPGNVSATVDVAADLRGPTITSAMPTRDQNAARNPRRNIVQSQDNQAMADNRTNLPNSTPRLRNYFPETLLWAPEVLTDENGKATVNFKMADNLTTWKMFAVASTKDGKIGVVEKEVTAFQPFFVDLDPPKLLTEGDEIYLPTQVRNYTPAKQRVSVTMTRADWFQLLTEPLVNIEVSPGSATNSVFGFRATTPIRDGKQKVAAIAQKESDAIEKSVTVRPNGHEVVRTESKLFSSRETFALDFPSNALANTPRATLKIYPNPMSHVTEAVEGLLMRPYGCGEQTISSAYPNMMILKLGVGDESHSKKARKYLQDGYGKLLGYQMSDGGFSYWGGKDASDIALTAYAIRFLTEASSIIGVDSDIIGNAADYLIKQQRADGSFTKKFSWETTEDLRRTKLMTTYVARSLAMVKARRDKPVSKELDATLDKALAYLKPRVEEIDEPYAMALYGLAAFDAGDRKAADQMTERLAKLAIAEGQTVYWNLETNTPFYGWGTAGRIETTALALQLLVKTNNSDGTNNEQVIMNNGLISKATMFLLKNKDRYGVWYSTQTTINVLDAFLASLKPARGQKIAIKAGGRVVREISIPASQIEPVDIDLSGQTSNEIEISGAPDAQIMAQVVRSHYVDWKNAEVAERDVNKSRAVELDYRCDKTAPKIMETVTCTVKAERVGFKGYGMLLAEIGIPPGAEVSRESLEKAVAGDWSISRYEIHPDRIVFYLWAKAGGTKFGFTFKPRYKVNAQTPASVLYDYYNEEAKATVRPMRFEVK